MSLICHTCFVPIEDQADTCPHCGATQKEDRDERALPVGYVLRDDYRLGKVLGTGSFGITYLARHIIFNENCVIKEYFPSQVVNRTHQDSKVTLFNQKDRSFYQDFKSRFIDEARILRSLTHPNIVKVSDAFLANETAYYAMEYAEGSSLENYLQANGKLSLEDAENYMLTVLDALQFIHERKVIHRDIKPDNILLTKNKIIRIIDFGAAKAAKDGKGKSTVRVGTEIYAAPEQLESSDVGPWTDIYATAATFYELLTGKEPPPFTTRYRKGEALDWAGSDVPEYLQSAIEDGMRLTNTKRIQSANEFIDRVKQKISNTDSLKTSTSQAATRISEAATKQYVETAAGKVSDISKKITEYRPPKVTEKKDKALLAVGGTVAVLMLAFVVFLSIDSTKDHPDQVARVEQDHQVSVKKGVEKPNVPTPKPLPVPEVKPPEQPGNTAPSDNSRATAQVLQDARNKLVNGYLYQAKSKISAILRQAPNNATAVALQKEVNLKLKRFAEQKVALGYEARKATSAIEKSVKLEKQAKANQSSMKWKKVLSSLDDVYAKYKNFWNLKNSLIKMNKDGEKEVIALIPPGFAAFTLAQMRKGIETEKVKINKKITALNQEAAKKRTANSAAMRNTQEIESQVTPLSREIASSQLTEQQLDGFVRRIGHLKRNWPSSPQVRKLIADFQYKCANKASQTSVTNRAYIEKLRSSAATFGHSNAINKIDAKIQALRQQAENSISFE